MANRVWMKFAPYFVGIAVLELIGMIMMTEYWAK